MKAKGPRIERETIIRWSEKGKYADLWTASQITYRRLLKNDYEPVHDRKRSATFRIPKQLVAIRKPRKLSKKRRQQLAKLARSLRRRTITTVARRH